MTAQAEFDEAVDVLHKMELEHVKKMGGYPPLVSTEIPGYVIVAGVSDDEPTLEVYEADQLLRWYRRAQEYMREQGDPNIIEAMWETSVEWEWRKADG